VAGPHAKELLPTPFSYPAAEQEIGPVPKAIILYSATGCPLCARYRALFDEQGYPFEERNTTEDPAYLDELAGLGIMATPAVLVGDSAVPGYRPNSVTELITA
jgi:glutaredoxin